jgi:oligopeptide transport system ATP-binding protein
VTPKPTATATATEPNAENRPAAAVVTASPTPLLRVRNLTVDLRSRRGVVRPVDDVSFDLERGETLVVLGESGSGKSMTAMALIDLLPSPRAEVVSGSVELDGVDLLSLPARELRHYRGAKIAMVFQDALSALNPVHTVGAQVSEVVRVHSEASRREARSRAVELMTHVGIPDAAGRYNDYPHQFSGGMRQRIMIAMAIAMNPSVLIADEPTTALDVTIQAQIIDLLEQLKAEYQMGVVLITHDLGVAAEIADQVVVMYAGKIVETGDASSLLTGPAHPYTAGLLTSMPATQRRRAELTVIGGAPPSLDAIPSGCSFRPRCPRAVPICADTEPELRGVGGRRASACHLVEELIHG